MFQYLKRSGLVSFGLCQFPETEFCFEDRPQERPKTEDLRIGSPFCFYPTGYRSYSVLNRTKHGSAYLLKRVRDSGYPGDVNLVKMEVTAPRKHTIRVKVRRNRGRC
jgi:hypothetical protein